MPSHTYNSILVTGVDSGSQDEHIINAWMKAQSLFEEDLVSNLTNVGDNFIRSFCIFPSGSGNERPTQMEHQISIELMVTYLSCDSRLEWVHTHWSENGEPPAIKHHHFA